jgi:hypothetical protein
MIVNTVFDESRSRPWHDRPAPATSLPDDRRWPADARAGANSRDVPGGIFPPVDAISIRPKIPLTVRGLFAEPLVVAEEIGMGEIRSAVRNGLPGWVAAFAGSGSGARPARSRRAVRVLLGDDSRKG